MMMKQKNCGHVNKIRYFSHFVHFGTRVHIQWTQFVPGAAAATSSQLSTADIVSGTSSEREWITFILSLASLTMRYLCYCVCITSVVCRTATATVKLQQQPATRAAATNMHFTNLQSSRDFTEVVNIVCNVHLSIALVLLLLPLPLDQHSNAIFILFTPFSFTFQPHPVLSVPVWVSVPMLSFALDFTFRMRFSALIWSRFSFQWSTHCAGIHVCLCVGLCRVSTNCVPTTTKWFLLFL